MYWAELIPLIISGSIFLFIPGFLLAWSLGMGLIYRFAAAPILSLGVLSLGAIVLGLLGIKWSPVSYLIFSLILIAIFAIVSFRLGNFTFTRSARRGTYGKEFWISLLGVSVGSLITAYQLKLIIGQPDAISQSYDNIFHLNAVRYITETGNGSSLWLNSMSSGDGSPGFYPAAWHDLTVLIFQIFPNSIPAATNATTFVAAALIWPLSILFLTLSFKRMGSSLLFFAPAFSGFFLAFPGLMMKWGILYPNLLGYALLPAFLGVLIRVVDHLREGWFRSSWEPSVLFIFGLFSVFLAHPNTVTSAAIIIIFYIGSSGFFLIRLPNVGGKEKFIRLTLLGLSAVACVGIWWFLRPPPEAGPWGPNSDLLNAIIEFLTNSPNGNLPLWSMSILTFAGVLFLLFKKINRWWVLSWLAVGAFWAAIAALPVGSLRFLITGPWYSDPFRIAALTAIPALILAAWGAYALTFFVRQVTELSRIRGGRNYSYALIGVFSVIIFVTAFQSQGLKEASQSAAREFLMDDVSLLITLDEDKVLENIDRYVPEEDVIAVNPWEGSALAYALADREVTSKHTLSSLNKTYLPITSDLSDLSKNPEVCKAVNEGNVRWYLHFVDTLGIGDDQLKDFKGLEGANNAPGLTPVYQAGQVGLYKITGC